MNTLKVSIVEVEIEGKNKKCLVFGNEAFDYEIDEAELSKAIHVCGKTDESRKALHGEIQAHFIGSLSEFLGWSVTLEELMEGIKNGYIERKAECTS